MTIFGNSLADSWEPAADPLWSADPSLKTAGLADMTGHVDRGPLARGTKVTSVLKGPMHVATSLLWDLQQYLYSYLVMRKTLLLDINYNAAWQARILMV